MKEYTVKEVASLFDKHEETIKRWIRSGKLPIINVVQERSTKKQLININPIAFLEKLNA